MNKKEMIWKLINQMNDYECSNKEEVVERLDRLNNEETINRAYDFYFNSNYDYTAWGDYLMWSLHNIMKYE